MADILYKVKRVVITELDPTTGLAKAGATPIRIDTAQEVELDPVISAGEEKVHRDEDQILAVATTDDLLYGYNLKLKDATFKTEAAAIIEGATLIYDEVEPTKVIGYDSPMLADGATFKPFKCELYVENYEGTAVKNYVHITLSNCRGKAPKMSLKKDFFAPEFDIKARENTLASLPVKAVRYVTSLPA